MRDAAGVLANSGGVPAALCGGVGTPGTLFAAFLLATVAEVATCAARIQWLEALGFRALLVARNPRASSH